jgi:hypothetical protein
VANHPASKMQVRGFTLVSAPLLCCITSLFTGMTHLLLTSKQILQELWTNLSCVKDMGIILLFVLNLNYDFIYKNSFQITITWKMAVFWSEAAFSLINVYQHFRGTCCLAQSILMMEAASMFETLVNIYQTIWPFNPEDSRLHIQLPWEPEIQALQDFIPIF